MEPTCAPRSRGRWSILLTFKKINKLRTLPTIERFYRTVLAATTQWTVVDMKRDWKVIFPFQKR
jgi:hypothetical protein